MTQRHAICLVVDGLRASALGAYGNTIYPTPQLDALASRSLVFDWLWADSPHLEAFYRSLWQGEHALRGVRRDEQHSGLQRLRKAGVQQWFVTDEPRLFEQAEDLVFDDVLLFENDAEHSAEELEDTCLGRYFSEVIERLHQWREDVADDNSMAWLHCRGMYGPWDAPRTLRDEMLDDEDPPATDFIQPPTELRNVDDPDMLLTYRVAYAAQIKLLDACIGAFMTAIEEAFAGGETLVMLTSSRGLALGEHGAIGTACTDLFSERLHLPWLMYPCGNTRPLPRHGSLAQPADLGATLLDWLGVCQQADGWQDGVSHQPLLSHGPVNSRQLAITVGNDTGDVNKCVIRSPAWMMQQASSDEELPTTELYAKPDDRWESNDIAGLFPGVVEQFGDILDKFKCVCSSGEPLPVIEPNEELVRPSR